ncbi:MAG: hypothetical protein ABI864_01170 [Chloroflexota bacterium]
MRTSSLKSDEKRDIPRRNARVRGIAVLGVVLLAACVSNPASTPGGGAILSAPASAAASQSRPDLAGRVVFLRTPRNGDEAVFTANADGTDEHQLSGIGDGSGVWATRDGERVLFSTLAPGDRVTTVTVNFDGSDRFVIPFPDDTLGLGPGPFSPDGTQIAFEGVSDEAHPELHGIYIGSADGTNVIQITHDNDIPGDWSPDGRQILFLRDPDGTSPGPDGLFVVNVNGSGEHKLTTDEVVVPCCWGYRWSPDGSRIVFPDGNGVLWLINPDGTDLIQLFRDDVVMHIRRRVITPTWSPDGTQIMFGLSPTPSPFDPSPNGLYVIDADGTGLTLAIGGANFKREPSWVP